MANVFTITTLLISVPIAEMMFVYIATLYGGSITLTTPMLWALAFIGEFLIGGVTGIFLGASGADIYFHDTYFVLAHFHYTFFPIAIIGTYAGVTYWFPKMFGKMMNETLGKIHFWGTIIPFNFIFIPLFVLGAAGEHRRIYDYQNFPELSGQWFCDAARVRDRLADRDAARAVDLLLQLLHEPAQRQEGAARTRGRRTRSSGRPTSPPPHGNFAELPTVYRGPYEYSVPGRERGLLAAERPELREGHRCDPSPRTRSTAGLPTGLLAVWWVLASEIVIFGGLLGSYVMHRLAHDAWAAQAANTNTWIGAFNTFVLLTSSLTAVLAHQAAEQGDGKLAARRLYYTCIGALTFICVKAFEWTIEIRARLDDLVEHLLVVLLHGRRAPRAARDRRRDPDAVRRRTTPRRATSCTASS